VLGAMWSALLGFFMLIANLSSVFRVCPKTQGSLVVCSLCRESMSSVGHRRTYRCSLCVCGTLFCIYLSPNFGSPQAPVFWFPPVTNFQSCLLHLSPNFGSPQAPVFCSRQSPNFQSCFLHLLCDLGSLQSPVSCFLQSPNFKSCRFVSSVY
jgi:hypothetical protein